MTIAVLNRRATSQKVQLPRPTGRNQCTALCRRLLSSLQTEESRPIATLHARTHRFTQASERVSYSSAGDRPLAMIGAISKLRWRRAAFDGYRRSWYRDTYPKI